MDSSPGTSTSGSQSNTTISSGKSHPGELSTPTSSIPPFNPAQGPYHTTYQLGQTLISGQNQANYHTQLSGASVPLTFSSQYQSLDMLTTPVAYASAAQQSGGEMQQPVASSNPLFVGQIAFFDGLDNFVRTQFPMQLVANQQTNNLYTPVPENKQAQTQKSPIQQSESGGSSSGIKRPGSESPTPSTLKQARLDKGDKPRKRTDQACDACKIAKIKCDETPNACKGCERKGLVCTQTRNGVSRPRLEDSHVDVLHAEISRLKKTLREKDAIIQDKVLEHQAMKLARDEAVREKEANVDLVRQLLWELRAKRLSATDSKACTESKVKGSA